MALPSRVNSASLKVWRKHTWRFRSQHGPLHSFRTKFVDRNVAIEPCQNAKLRILRAVPDLLLYDLNLVSCGETFLER